ncbi:sporulation-delaying protein SdpB family protein [Streptomyces cinnamoneus]|uniref:sporulation-delaying protein SdpB family protein n=1 Tax=Streptomyces cinnamoneus TaxID=53446 RepID=UPI0034367334
MLNTTGLGRRTRGIPLPWGNAYGLARTLLALGTAGTLAFSSSATLFRPVVTIGEYPLCKGMTAGGAFCLVPRGQFDLLRWLCVAVLLLVASGWRPRLTALPHAYISFSVFSGIAIGDGGDQITWILSLLLALVALGDGRRWHWQTRGGHAADDEPVSRATRGWALLGTSAWTIARLQMALLYFQASVAKLPHTEWADGSAMYYWANNSSFGFPEWIRPLTDLVVYSPAGIAALTWLPIALELALAASPVMSQRARWVLLPLGIAFHLGIALLMGLWSFALAMWAGLFLLLSPIGHSFPALSANRSRKKQTSSSARLSGARLGAGAGLEAAAAEASIVLREPGIPAR